MSQCPVGVIVTDTLHWYPIHIYSHNHKFLAELVSPVANIEQKKTEKKKTIRQILIEHRSKFVVLVLQKDHNKIE